jgi:hypothetical protein
MKICNISVEFSIEVFNCFNKPYFQPYFSDETTLVAMDFPKNKPYYLIKKANNKVIRLDEEGIIGLLRLFLLEK